ncbi:MAG: hypothetical protein VYB17_03175, partial [Candidatus Thermoplasmatota archaeon]|nr:hypothetical protein [Candidatus Thermoplasmatota archaeon]
MTEESYRFLGRNMPEISIAVGNIFAIWGLAAYIISDMASWTALIPMFIGGPIATMGILAKAMPDKRKTFMHISAMFGLLCALGGLRLPMILMADDSTDLLIASHAILLVLGSLYTYLCVQSFIWA